MTDAIIKGVDLTALQEKVGSPIITATALAYTNSTAPQAQNIEVRRLYTCLTSKAADLIPTINSADADHTTCYCKEIRITPGQSEECEVEVIFRTEDVTSAMTLNAGEKQEEMDVGVIASPIELNPYFADLTDDDLEAVRLRLADPINNDKPSSDLANELLTYRLQGVDSYYIPTPIFRKTQAKTDSDFGFGNIGMRDKPSSTATLSGDASNWLKTSYRVTKKGGIYHITEEWSYSGDTWDSNLYADS